MRNNLSLLLLFFCSCASSDRSAASPTHDAANEPTPADAAEEQAPLSDAAEDSTATCPVCAPKSYTCAALGIESASMSISPIDSGSCTGTLPGVPYVIKCAPAEICHGASCTTYDFDGYLLKFNHFGTQVTCHA